MKDACCGHQAVPSARAPQRAAAEPIRDAERTKAAILQAALDEFAEKGLAGARVDTIAEQSGANKRMLYYYFGNKEDLYVAVLERRLRRHAADRERARPRRIWRRSRRSAEAGRVQVRLLRRKTRSLIRHARRREHARGASFSSARSSCATCTSRWSSRSTSCSRPASQARHHAAGHRSAAALHLDRGAELFLLRQFARRCRPPSTARSAAPAEQKRRRAHAVEVILGYVPDLIDPLPIS